MSDEKQATPRAQLLAEIMDPNFAKNEHGWAAADRITELEAEVERLRNTPIDCVLFCPKCGTQHIDQPQPEKDWNNPPHRTHECQKCGHLWRPGDAATNGVPCEALSQATARADRLAELLGQVDDVLKAAYGECLADQQGHDRTAQRNHELICDWKKRRDRALTEAPVGGWRPIEEAPRDGRDLLLYLSGCDQNCLSIVIGHWSMGADGVQRPDDDWYETRSDGGPWLDVPPTHFQYLPTPPNGGK